MVKVGEKLLIAVKVKSITETSKGISYRVTPLDEDRSYDTMEIVDADIRSFLEQDEKGRK